jgi:hypothetical protein
MKRLLKSYIFALLFGAIVCIFALFLRGIQNCKDIGDIYRVLCDCFTIPSVLCLTFGALINVSRLGTFDGICFVCRKLLSLALPNTQNRVESFYDYKMRKKSQNTISYPFPSPLIFSGTIFMIIALMFLILYALSS